MEGGGRCAGPFPPVGARYNRRDRPCRGPIQTPHRRGIPPETRLTAIVCSVCRTRLSRQLSRPGLCVAHSPSALNMKANQGCCEENDLHKMLLHNSITKLEPRLFGLAAPPPLST
jgi:hypothetical protein